MLPIAGLFRLCRGIHAQCLLGSNESGKNIVLLSDGTGNSAAKASRTNIWRLYCALDLTGGEQVAFYDDDVGAQNFLPFKLLGGPSGLVLRRMYASFMQRCAQTTTGAIESVFSGSVAVPSRFAYLPGTAQTSG